MGPLEAGLEQNGIFMGDFEMSFLVVFLLALLVPLAGSAGKSGECSVSVLDMQRIEKQLEHYRHENKGLTEEERKSLDEALEQIKARSGSNGSLDVDNRVVLDGITEFTQSPAYEFLNGQERSRLKELLSWIKGKGCETETRPPAFLAGSEQAEEETTQTYPPSGLRDGDLVFRREDAFLSHHFVEASKRERRFSHVGVVVIRNGAVKAISVGEGGASLGVVKFADWSTFVSKAVDCAVYRFAGDASIGERIARAAEKRIGIPFDPAFDLRTKDRLYCSELVRDAVNEAVGKPVIGTTKKGTFEYVAIDDCYRSGWTKVFDAKEGK